MKEFKIGDTFKVEGVGEGEIVWKSKDGKAIGVQTQETRIDKHGKKYQKNVVHIIDVASR